jgi:hypothetical protein
LHSSSVFNGYEHYIIHQNPAVGKSGFWQGGGKEKVVSPIDKSEDWGYFEIERMFYFHPKNTQGGNVSC